MTAFIKHSVESYHIAWIAALAIERSAASEMLDETHEEPKDFIRNATDQNSYDWGRIHGHNLVITSLPTAIYGKVNAAHTVTELLASLPHIKIGLLVGIGAGLPSAQHDIRLGDVVVSQPEGSHGGVIQYDLGKANADGSWEPKGFLQPPPIILLKALSNLQAKHESGQFRLTEFLSKAMERNKYWAGRYAYPTGKTNRLHRSKRLHDDEGYKIYTEEGDFVHSDRSSNEPMIHFGTIASGDTLIKNALVRDDIPAKVRQTCLCIEMEAAGLLSKFPCMVIRGICDHADSQKSDDWQRYASATAAAFTKELLLYVPPADLPRTRNAADLMGLRLAVEQLMQSIENGKEDLQARNVAEFLKLLYSCPYEERKDRNIPALDGTCQWFIQHTRFLDWKHQSNGGLLWVSADPGCGKSVLTRYLIDKVLCADTSQTITYFFFKDDFVDQRSADTAMHSILRQLLMQRPYLQQKEILNRYPQDGKKLKLSFKASCDLFLHLTSKIMTGNVICILDALDECQQTGRRLLIEFISDFYQQLQQNRVKFLITSRPYGIIKDMFYDLIVKYPTVHLSGESELEAEEISNEIGIVIRHRISLLSKRRSLTPKEELYLRERFTSVPHRTYLWAYLTMNIIETTPGLTKGRLEEELGRLPQTVNEAYEKILDRSSDVGRTRLLLQILVAAQRPLSLQEVSLFLCIQEHHRVEDFADVIEPPDRFKQSVRDLCGLFVIVVNDLVYFLHQTAREFLVPDLRQSGQGRLIQEAELINDSSKWAASIGRAASHRVLAERCLWFMFIEGAPNYDGASFEYCNKFWAGHFAFADTLDVGATQTELALRVFIAWAHCYGALPSDTRTFHALEGTYLGFSMRHCSPITFAAFFRCHSVVKLILKQTSSHEERIRIASNGLWWAVVSGDLTLIRLLLSNGANPNINCRGKLQSIDPARTKYWFTPLTIAIKNGHNQTVHMLLEAGADPNMKMLNYWTQDRYTSPLGLATSMFDAVAEKWKLVEIIKTLLSHGADPKAECYGSNPWSWYKLTTPLILIKRSIDFINPPPAERKRLLHLFGEIDDVPKSIAVSV